MKNLLIIGAGGVGAAVLHKFAQFSAGFGRICIASRTLSKCDAIIESAHQMGNLKNTQTELKSRSIDAMEEDAVREAIRSERADIVVNVASPYCNLSILNACIAEKVDYLDTAVHETEGEMNMPPPWYANYEWKLKDACHESGISAILGIGFDPGAVNVFCAYAKKHLFDRIQSIDILDVNGGDHGRYFATNFDPETNLREILEDVMYFENGNWRKVGCHSRSREFDFPQLGKFRVFSMGHDEIHSLAAHIPADRIEFWMGFGEQYLKVFDVLKNLGLLSNQAVNVEGQMVQPIKLLKAVLPDPSTLAQGYKGECCIGTLIKGEKDGSSKTVLIYSLCDHEACYADVGSQAISYTTAVPVVTAALLLANGKWSPGTMVNVEELDPDPFLSLMPEVGIDWQVRDEENSINDGL